VRWITAVVLACTLNACGYDGTYRYPCQNPDNWSNAECQPPVCKADGTCTEYLIPQGLFDDEN
jgi:hypothetical protein